MEIFAKTHRDNVATEKLIPLHVQRSDTIKSVKGKIEEKEHISTNAQRIMFGGQQLDDEKTISDYNIQRGSCLHVVFRGNSFGQS